MNIKINPGINWKLLDEIGLGTALLLCLLLAAPQAHSQIITTFAGNGNGTSSGDGGAANSAAINLPTGLAVDAAGNVYISDTADVRIRKVNPAGIISTFAGNGISGESGDQGPAIGASFSDVYGLAADSAGNLYIADASNRRVRKINPSGIVTTVTGTGAQGNTGDGGQAASATLNRPIAVALDPSGNLYICDSANHNIRKVNLSSGIITTYAGNGLASFSGDGGQAVNAALQFPLGIAFDRSGNLYIADTGNNCIRKVTPTGIITTVAGNGNQAGFSGDGFSASISQMNLPSGVTVDSTGNIFISDSGNNRVREINTAGTIDTIAGSDGNGFSGDNGPPSNALLNYPWTLTVDASGSLYVCDRLNYRVRKITGFAAPALPLPPPVTTQTATPQVTSLTPRVTTGNNQVYYALQLSDASGWQDINVVNMLVNNFLDGRQACYLAYTPGNNTVYLVPDSGGGLLPGVQLGSSGAAANSQCSISGAGSGASGSGASLTLNLNITFTSAFAGNHVVYAAARSLTANSGWLTMGTVGVPPMPSTFPNALSVTPADGITTNSVLSFTFADANSAANLQTAWALINTALDGRSACYVAYYRPANQLYLIPDSGDATQAQSMPLSGAGSLGNSQCTVMAQGSSATLSGNRLILNLNVAFKPGFSGSKDVWMAVQTVGGAQTSPWQPLGSWQVP